MDLSIASLLNNYLQDKQKEHLLRERSGKWNPSSFGKCYRAQFGNRKNETKSDAPDERSLRVFQCGKIFHEFVQSIITSSNPGGEIELRVETPNVLGFADIVLDDEVVEIKSQHSKAFWYFENKDFSITSEKPDHVLQGMFYCVILDKQFLRLVYISKDDLCMSEYKIQVTEQWKEAVTAEIEILENFWNENLLPPAIPRLYKGKNNKSKECKYCAYKTKCFGLGGPDKELIEEK